MRELLKKLLAEYGTAAERKNNSIARGSRLIVDGRGAGDLGADGQPHASFCAIAVDVASASDVTVALQGNVPWCAALEEWFTRNAAVASRTGARSLSLRLSPESFAALTDVARILRDVGKPATPRFVPPPLKYACLRTARSLGQLHLVLGRAWSRT